MKLPKIVQPSKKRVGRGHGSGKVKTAGRGTKGQKARGTVRRGFEGGQLSLTHRLPFLRGKGRNKSLKHHPVAIPIRRLHIFDSGETVSIATLKNKGLISQDTFAVKLIGNSGLTVSIHVEGLLFSARAKQTIEKAGGSVRS